MEFFIIIYIIPFVHLYIFYIILFYMDFLQTTQINDDNIKDLVRLYINNKSYLPY